MFSLKNGVAKGYWKEHTITYFLLLQSKYLLQVLGTQQGLTVVAKVGIALLRGASRKPRGSHVHYMGVKYNPYGFDWTFNLIHAGPAE